MKIEYDNEADALYIQIKEDSVDRTQELENGVALDFDANNNLIGIEILGATKRYSRQDIFDVTTKNLLLETG
jgi:uncharacterized protein YuzE